MSKALLQIKALDVDYGGVRALRNVSLDVREGEIVCVIGGNGAGKTTLANAICGLIKPVQGEIHFKEQAIQGLAPHRVVKLGIIQVPEGRGIFTTLTVLENLKVGAYRNASQKAIAESLGQIYTIFPVLRKRSKQLGGSLSGGEQQMLAIGRGLMAGPHLLLLDEPTLGLSPLMRQEVAKVIQKINRTGTSIMLVEQDAQMALRISHKGIVLQNGQMVMQGTCQELLNNPLLKESYLS